MSVFIGCSGWSYSDTFEKGGWVKAFYPDAQTKKLQSTLIFLIQLKWMQRSMKNSTYMTKDTFTAMVRATPDNFQFSIKAPETVTHDNKLDVR